MYVRSCDSGFPSVLHCSYGPTILFVLLSKMSALSRAERYKKQREASFENGAAKAMVVGETTALQGGREGEAYTWSPTKSLASARYHIAMLSGVWPGICSTCGPKY